jgi:hypothetical protein
MSIETTVSMYIEWNPTDYFKGIAIFFDISMGLNGIPLCINVKYKRKSFNSI